MVFKWKEEHTPRFLEHYVNYPCLWDVKLPSYSNRELRTKARKSFLKDLNIEGVTDQDVKLKVKSIRTRYTAELKKIQRSRKSGCPEEEVYVPRLFWFQQADKFLNAVCVPRDTAPNRAPKGTKTSNPPLLEEITSVSCDSIQSNSSLSSGSDYKRFKRDRSNRFSQALEISIEEEQLASLKKSPSEEMNNHQSVDIQETGSWSNSTRYYTNNQPSNSHPEPQGVLCMLEDRLTALRQDDEYDIIGKNVATKLRSVLPIQKIYAEKIINDTLYEAQLNNLSRHSQLYNPS